MRRLLPPVVLVLSALLVGACAGSDGRDGTPAATAVPIACGETELVPEQSGGHLLGDAGPPQPYNSVPPTSGWHAAGAPEYGVHGEGAPLSEPEQVTVLELGGVVLAHRDLADPQRVELEALAGAHERVAVTPYDRLEPGQVAMTAWGVLRRCDGVDRGVIEAFVAEHAGGGPAH